MEVSFNIAPIALAGAITRADIVEQGGVAPINNIRSDQDWGVEVDWYLEGWILNSAFFQFLGEWTVTLYLESMGPGVEYEFSTTVPVSVFAPVAPNRRDYTATVALSAGDVVPGTYKGVVAITYAAGGTPGPIAGHTETDPELVQVYAV